MTNEAMETAEAMNTVTVMVNTGEEIVLNTKYKVGDKVFYLDITGDEKVGTINEVLATDVYKWNKEVKPLYLLSSSPYYRSEDEILGCCAEFN